MKKIYPSLTLQAYYLIIGKFLLFIFTILHPVILVRVFSQSDYGLYKQLMLIFTTLLPIGQMGLSQALFYFLPRETAKRIEIIGQTIVLIICFASIILFFVIFFKNEISQFFNNNDMRKSLHLLAIYCFFMIASSLLESILIADGKAKLASIYIVLFQFFHTSTIVIVSLYSRSIIFLLYSLIIFSMLRFIFQTFYLKIKYEFSFFKIRYSSFKTLLTYSLPIGLDQICWLLQLNLSSYFVSFYFIAKDFAVYAIGTTNVPIHIVTNSVANVMIPSMARLQKYNKKDEIIKIWNNSVRKMNLIIFPLIVYCFFLSKELIIAVFTANYIESVNIFRISLFSFLVAGLNAGAVLKVYAETKYLMRIGMIRLPIALFLIYLLTKIWGMIGAISANVILTLSFRFIILFKISNVIEIPFFQIVQWKVNANILMMSILTIIPIIIIKKFLLLQPIFILFITFPLYLLLYFFINVSIGNIRPDESRSLLNQLKSFFKFS